MISEYFVEINKLDFFMSWDKKNIYICLFFFKLYIYIGAKRLHICYCKMTFSFMQGQVCSAGFGLCFFYKSDLIFFIKDF